MSTFPETDTRKKAGASPSCASTTRETRRTRWTERSWTVESSGFRWPATADRRTPTTAAGEPPGDTAAAAGGRAGAGPVCCPSRSRSRSRAKSHTPPQEEVQVSFRVSFQEPHTRVQPRLRVQVEV